MLLRSTCVPGLTGPKIVAVFDETKRRPSTSTSVRCEPRPKKSTKVCPAPNGDCVPAALLPGGPKAGISPSACATLV